MRLVPYSPVASLEGFPGGRLPGEWVLEALVLAAFAHLVRKDKAFAERVRRFVLEGAYAGSGELVSGLREYLFQARPELSGLALSDLPLEGVERRRLLVFDLERKEVVGDREGHLFDLDLTLDLPPVLKALAPAARSFAESLAAHEGRSLAGTPLGPFYQRLRARIKGSAFPLRLGDYADDLFRTWLLPFYRVREVAAFLWRRFHLTPWPRRVYAWKGVTLGWVFLETDPEGPAPS
ncbi:hypothetical protein [Thermus islandicus]|uniref:hypothetical protein n=1 Tax=Thermus islandicus TaxID=540988 RepID=UPI0003B32B0A|nr:hypothetical protein [Thermus islandicus]